MKKFVFTLFILLVILLGLPGCKTTRATLKSNTRQELRQAVVTDTSRTEQTKTSDQITAALSSSEQKNVVITFEEWEYYPATGDTITGENYAQNNGYIIRTSEDADKPPNAGSLKKRRKGTITINADKKTEATAEQSTQTEKRTDTSGKGKVTTVARAKQDIKTIESTSKGGKWYIWLIGGLVMAALFIWVGKDISRHAKG